MFVNSSVDMIAGGLSGQEGSRGYVVGEEMGVNCVEEGGEQRSQDRFESCDERAVVGGVEGEEGVEILYSAWKVG